ncbi:DUF6193 family natural product biosynthesis protein [Streptomyces sp. NPDC006872]|uniref:DUF6193 family natural product biosynthesis protein n=1 Tax=Streptomyces sp. NPDC006872 TaxID=3155720 RepID=UPI003400D721
MTGENTSRSLYTAWNDLLQEFHPPHPKSDPYTPALWTLLQVAHLHPLLRTLYPELSTTMLTFSRTDDFRMREGERFPFIGAAAGEFGACACPVSENNIPLRARKLNGAEDRLSGPIGKWIYPDRLGRGWHGTGCSAGAGLGGG